MRTRAYPLTCVASDLTRASAGFAICATPLILADTLLPGLTVILALLAAVFTLFAGRALLLAGTRVEWDHAGVQSRALRHHWLPWKELRRFKLAYYSTRRDRSGGWLQLSLGGNTGRMTFDSRLDDFEVLVGEAARAARSNAVPLDAATRYNLRVLGIAVDAIDLAEARA